MNTKNIFFSSLAVAGLFVFSSCGHSDVPTYKDQREPVNVQISNVSTEASGSQLSLSGTVASDNKVDISAKVMGYIEYLPFAVGDKIQAGATVARIKNQEVNTKVDQVEGMIEEARIGLAAIEKDHNRIKRLYEQQSATQKELDDVTTMMETTKARIKQLEASRKEAGVFTSYSAITSPISGIVTYKYKDKGEMASPGYPLLTVEDNKDKIIQVSIPESYILKIKDGQEVKYKLQSEENWNSGKITDISTAASSGQYPAKIKIPASSPYLSGMFTEVAVDIEISGNPQEPVAVKVPKSALIKKGQLTGIFVPSDQNTALLRWVITGNTLGDQVEILSGLSSGEKYISQANSRLMNGMPIQY